MLRHCTGRIAYLNEQGDEVGREWFRISQNADRSRTLRAVCEMDEQKILRDVVLTVDEHWAPLDSFVRLAVDGKFSGSSWFGFSDTAIDCEGILAEKGRWSETLDVPNRPAVFAAHALACDGWQAGAFDHSRPEKVQSILSSHCSVRPDGGSGPLPGINGKEIEYIGEDKIIVRAGAFDARHYLIHTEREDWPPLHLWVAGDDNFLVKLEWDILGLSYELTQLDIH